MKNISLRSKRRNTRNHGANGRENQLAQNHFANHAPPPAGEDKGASQPGGGGTDSIRNSPADNVFLNGAILGMSREVRSKFDDIAGFAGLRQFIDTPVKRYSSDMCGLLSRGALN